MLASAGIELWGNGTSTTFCLLDIWIEKVHVHGEEEEV
jgi:hypothetical protein